MHCKSLKYMPYAQAHVEDWYPYDVPRTVLWSYTTQVVKVVKGHWVSCSGLYSMTTRKHISAFMREYFPQLDGKGFQIIKGIAGRGVELNIDTGEIRELDDLTKWY